MALAATEQVQSVCSDASRALLPWHDTINQQIMASYDSGKLPHALNLVGPEFIGKRHYAQQLARALLCTSPQQGLACGKCKSCLLCEAGTHPDLMHIAPEATGKALKVDTIRYLQYKFQQTAQQGDKKIAVIGPAEAMNENAANALLKLLEEPPQDTYFILLTHHASKLLPTITSRCQRVSFAVPAESIVLAWLGEQYAADDVAAAMRDGRGLPLRVKAILDAHLDIAFELDAIESLFAGKLSAQELAGRIDASQLVPFLDSLMQLVNRCMKNEQHVGTTPIKTVPALVSLPGDALQRIYQQLADAKRALSHNANPRLLTEALLLQCVGIHGEFNS